MQRKIYYLHAICIVLALFYSCKKDKTDKDTNPQKTEAQQLADLFNIQDEALLIYSNSLKENNDTAQAVLTMGKWLTKQEGVERVVLADYGRLNVRYKNGINTSINIIKEGPNGEHYIRSGGGRSREGSITTYHFKGKGTGAKNIESEKVLILCPYLYEFYDGNYPYLSLFEDSKVPLDVTLVTERKCTIDFLETFHNYGFIILNTHGNLTGAFSLYCGMDKFDLPEVLNMQTEKWTASSIEDFLKNSGNDMYQKIKQGKYEFEISGLISTDGKIYRQVEIGITGLAVREISTKLKDAVVFGNYCFSGQKNEGEDYNGETVRNIPEAWKTAGAAAYYAYEFADGTAAAVYDSFARSMEKRIITRLVKNGDSTGIAHLDENLNEYSMKQKRARKVLKAIQVTDSLTPAKLEYEYERYQDDFYCKLFHSPQYAYGCGVFTDPRDGEKYQLACIGDQVWFAENLRYNASGSVVYNNDNSNLAKYGRLYNYTIVSAGQGIGSITGQGLQGICPNGWHLPNKEEMEKLMATLSTYGSANDYGKMLKAKVLWEGENAQDLDDPLRNVVGFNALPAGKAIYTEDGRMNYFLEKEDATFWGSSPGPVSPNSTTSVIILNTSIHSTSLGDFTVIPRDYDYLSCRCLQDKE